LTHKKKAVCYFLPSNMCSWISSFFNILRLCKFNWCYFIGVAQE